MHARPARRLVDRLHLADDEPCAAQDLPQGDDMT